MLGGALTDRTAAGVRAPITILKPAVNDEDLLLATRSNATVPRPPLSTPAAGAPSPGAPSDPFSIPRYPVDACAGHSPQLLTQPRPGAGSATSPGRRQPANRAFQPLRCSVGSNGPPRA